MFANYWFCTLRVYKVRDGHNQRATRLPAIFMIKSSSLPSGVVENVRVAWLRSLETFDPPPSATAMSYKAKNVTAKLAFVIISTLEFFHSQPQV